MQQSSSVVQQPSSVVQQPSSVVQQPSSVVQQPSSVVQQPTSVLQQSTTSVVQNTPPSSVVQQPKSSTGKKLLQTSAPIEFISNNGSSGTGLSVDSTTEGVPNISFTATTTGQTAEFVGGKSGSCCSLSCIAGFLATFCLEGCQPCLLRNLCRSSPGCHYHNRQRPWHAFGALRG